MKINFICIVIVSNFSSFPTLNCEFLERRNWSYWSSYVLVAGFGGHLKNVLWENELEKGGRRMEDRTKGDKVKDIGRPWSKGRMDYED